MPVFCDKSVLSYINIQAPSNDVTIAGGEKVLAQSIVHVV